MWAFVLFLKLEYFFVFFTSDFSVKSLSEFTYVKIHYVIMNGNFTFIIMGGGSALSVCVHNLIYFPDLNNI